MLVKVSPPSADFHVLARYLVRGKHGTMADPDRVAWTIGHNLPTGSPELAAKIMSATAELSPRVKKAVYHMMIAWAPIEKPAPELMQRVALQALDLAGLADHQALIMGHGDKPHDHCHLLINRVHPSTGKAWKSSHDYARWDAIMRQLADQHGFQFASCHTFNREATNHLPKKPNSRAAYAAKRGANTNRLQWSRAQAAALAAELSGDLDLTSTTDDIAARLADHGLNVEPKGTGFVAGNAASYVKLSALNLAATAKGQLRRLRKAPAASAARRAIFTVDGVDIVRALVGFGLADRSQLRTAIDDASAARAIKLEQRSLLLQLLHNATATTAHTPPPSKAKPIKRTRARAPSRSR